MNLEEIQKLIDASIETYNKGVQSQFSAIETAIEDNDKKIEGLGIATPKKKKKAAPPIELKIDGKDYRAKTNIFLGKNSERVDLSQMNATERKAAFKQYPTIFNAI